MSALPVVYQGSPVPQVVRDAGGPATTRFVEFFTVNIRNPNTRKAYALAIAQFLGWCAERGVSLSGIEPITVAAYIETHPGSPPTVKQHLAAIRMLFDWLVVGQIVPRNPAHSVRGPKHVVKKGKTPVLSADEARLMLESIDCSTATGLRDRALIATMLYSFARVGAVLAMDARDFYQRNAQWWLRLHEKGGKHHEVPAHHKVVAYLHEYMEKAGISLDDKSPLFRSSRRDRTLANQRLKYIYAYQMIKRRARNCGIPPTNVSCHTFRATGITMFLENGGSIETAQRIAAHESPTTTKLYDHTADVIDQAEIERIRI